MNGKISPIGEKLKPMSAEQARACIEAIKERVEDIRILALELYEREGWRSLGYESWRECVTSEFDQSQSYLYRQLQAALIEREISPIGEKLGAIPESQIRPLAKLPDPEQRKEAWEEAKAAAPGGKPKAKHVERAVNQRLGKPDPKPKPEANGHHGKNGTGGKSLVNGMLADDPPEIARARAAGRIAPEVVPEVTEPEGEPTPAVPEPESAPEGDLSDEAWLDTLPIRSKLGENARVLFDRDALAFRKVEGARDAFALAARSVLKAADRRGSLPAYLHRLRGFLRINHPKHWTLCPDEEYGGCGGKGIVGVIGICTMCHGCGYKI